MDDSALERTTSIANRDEPIPVIRIPSRDDEPTTSDSEVEGDKGRRDKLKDKAKTVRDAYSPGISDFKQGIQDRFFENLMAKVIPTEQPDEDEIDAQKKRKEKLDRRSRKYVERPNFSLGQMNSNFRRFNSRIGIAFVLQNRMIRLFSWKDPIATLSFVAVYTLVCLQPHLLPLLPLVGILFFVMAPSFLARHPIPANDPRIEPTFRGPAVAPASRVKPAPEMSKDFFRNMRDLQNCMEDFSQMHDAANEWITPYTNFSDEKLSSELYTCMFILSMIAFISAQLVPWKLIALIGGWSATIMGHPDAQAFLLSSRLLKQIIAYIRSAQTKVRAWVESDIILDEPPERRQVEIFELQKYHLYSDSWEPWLYSPTPYDPLSPQRISGARPKGTQFFEDVQAPTGWLWRDKKWSLDLASREWVEQRMITGVEIETEGARWVYDLPDEAVQSLESPTKAKKNARQLPKSGWEEGNGFGERGDWRRRRWIRLVERKMGARPNPKPG